MKKLGDHAQVAAEIAFGPLGDSLAALRKELADNPMARLRILRAYPGYQHAFGKRRVRILYFDEGKLDAAVRELVQQVDRKSVV